MVMFHSHASLAEDYFWLHDVLFFTNEPATRGICLWISPADLSLVQLLAFKNSYEVLGQVAGKTWRGRTWFALYHFHSCSIIFSQQLGLWTTWKDAFFFAEITSRLTFWGIHSRSILGAFGLHAPSTKTYLSTSLYHKWTMNIHEPSNSDTRTGPHPYYICYYILIFP